MPRRQIGLLLLFLSVVALASPALRAEEKLRIIAFGAHPDDCELRAAGMAARWAAAGHAVKFVSLTNGDAGHFAMSGKPLAERRKAARAEVEHLISLIESEPMGIQIGVIEEVLPNMAFQLFRTAERTFLGISPFRLGGELPNIRSGVAMVTADIEPVRLYETLVDDLWRRARKGKDAAALLQTILSRSAIAPPGRKRGKTA